MNQALHQKRGSNGAVKILEGLQKISNTRISPGLFYALGGALSLVSIGKIVTGIGRSDYFNDSGAFCKHFVHFKTLWNSILIFNFFGFIEIK